MQYRTLGRTCVQVSTLVLGAMNFGGSGRTTQDKVTAMVDTAVPSNRPGSMPSSDWPRSPTRPV